MMSYFQDGGHDVISCTKVPPPDECIHVVPMQQLLPVPGL